MNVATLALALVLVAGAAGPQADPSPAAPPSGAARDYDNPPPGASPQDQALWHAAYDASNDILLTRNAATLLQLRARQGSYDERLATLARHGADAATRARTLDERLTGAWKESLELLMRPWPVDPTRGCRYPLLTFESVLLSGDHPRRSSQLASAREDLQECVTRAQAILSTVRAANARFDGVLSELESALSGVPAEPPSPPPGPTTSSR